MLSYAEKFTGFIKKFNPFTLSDIYRVQGLHVGHGGGHHLGSRSAGGKWSHSISSPGTRLILNHRLLRQGARVAMQDSPQGRAIVERKVDAIANTGLKLEPTPDASLLGITQERAAEWGRDVSKRFNLWAVDKKQNRPEIMSFYQAQWLYTYFKERDNDIFVRLFYSPDRDLQNPLQFGFLDPEQIRGHAITTSSGLHHVNDGIVRDARGRETAYNVWIKNIDGTIDSLVIQAKGPKSGRIFMLHGWRPEYAGQGRGFTKLAPILQELENFTDFSLAHIKQAINQASIMGWVVPSKDEDSNPVFQDNLTTFGAGPANKNFSNDPEETGSETSHLAGEIECYDIPEASYGVPGSMFLQDLTKGADIKFGNPNAPSTTYDAFQNAFLTSLSASTGTPLEVVFMKFANNFSASRATLLLFQRIVEIEREDMVVDFLSPTYEMWMAGEIAAGRITAPGWNDPRLKRAWLKATWRGPSAPDIDPGKLAKAREINLKLGATNIERESQQHSGMSAEDNISLNNAIYEDYEPLPFAGTGETAENGEDDKKED